MGCSHPVNERVNSTLLSKDISILSFVHTKDKLILLETHYRIDAALALSVTNA